MPSGSLGVAAGVLLGGALTTWASWQAIFWINVPIGVVALLVGRHVIAKDTAPRPSVRDFDLPGAVAVIGGLATLIYGISGTETHGWWSVQTVAALAVSAILLVALPQARAARDASRCSRRTSGSSRPWSPVPTVMLGVTGILVGTVFLTSIFVQTVLGFSALETGLGFLPFAFAITAGTVVARHLLAHVSPRVIASRRPAHHRRLVRVAVHRRQRRRTSPPTSCPGCPLLGLGVGMVFVPVSVTSMAGIPASHAGVASGFLMTGHEIGAALGVAILSAVASRPAPSPPRPVPPTRSRPGSSAPPSWAPSSRSSRCSGCPPPGSRAAAATCTCTDSVPGRLPRLEDVTTEETLRRTPPSWTPWRTVVAFGTVSLAGDMVYEGMRSVAGPFLASLGASALAVGLITGAGEAIALVLRLFSGPYADRGGRYWSLTIVGYAMTAICVPLLAVTPFVGSLGLALAATLILLERAGKAIRSPSKSALLARVAVSVGRGRGFAVHKALDQVGAFAGPLLVAGVIALVGATWPAFAVLAVPGAVCMLLLFSLKRHSAATVPDRSAPDPPPAPASTIVEPRALSMQFYAFATSCALGTLGLMTFGVISFHLVDAGLVATAVVPLIYAAAMATEAVAAL